MRLLIATAWHDFKDYVGMWWLARKVLNKALRDRTR